MNKLLKYLLSVAAVVLWAPAAATGPFAHLEQRCAPGQIIQLSEPILVDGVIVSDYRSLNMELNPNLNVATVDRSVNDCTVYLQAADGSRSIRLVFDEPSENRLARYDRVRFDLNGCSLTHNADPDCLTVTGVGAANVVAVTPGAAGSLPVKERYISELTDKDLYTFVTLRDAEFVFKEGSYTNIWEPYGMFTPELHHYKYDVVGRMDGWATLVRDSQGGAIYMPVNLLCGWRRTGKPLPQGMGPLSGVVVHTSMRRYGGAMGRYSIRPLDESDIAVSRKKNSPWKRLTGWVLDGSAGASLQFELMGYQNNLTKESAKSGDRILNDVGSRGYLWTDSNAYIFVDSDYNALGTDNKGWVSFGSICFRAPTPDWYRWDAANKMTGMNSLLVEFSTRKIRGTELSISFEAGIGNHDANFSWNFPLEWRVEYAVDGGKFLPLKDAATGSEIFVMRPLPWWDNVVEGSGNVNRLFTSYDCGLGLQQHIFALPETAFDRDQVVVRISPASGLLSQIRSNPANDARLDGAVVRKNCRQTTLIRVGSLTVDYK